MRYVESKLEYERRDSIYRIYVTDSLQCLPKLEYLETRYAELVGMVHKDTRTADEIAADVIEKAGLSI